MTRKIHTFLAVLIVCATAFAAQKSEHLGAAFTDAKAVALKDVISDVGKFDGKTIKVEGQIADVCQMKGCWLVVT